MDLVTLILLCSLVPNRNVQLTLYQIAQTTEQQTTYIDDLTDAQVYTPARRKRASKMTDALLEAGHELRVGLGYVDASQAIRTYGISSGRLVRSCPNIAVASDMLSISMSKFDDPERALAHYFSGDPEDEVGLRWAQRVLSVEPVDLEKASRRPTQAPPSPKFGVDSRLFISDDATVNGATHPRARRSLAPKGVDSSSSPRGDDTSKPPYPPLEKWGPPKVDEEEPRESDSSNASAASGSSSAKSSSSSPERSSPGGAYPDVTDERLSVPDEESSSDG